MEVGKRLRQKRVHVRALFVEENVLALPVRIRRRARERQTCEAFDGFFQVALTSNSLACQQYTTKILATLLLADHSPMPWHFHSRHRPLDLNVIHFDWI